MDDYAVLFSPSRIGMMTSTAISKEVTQGGSELNSTRSKWVLHRSSRGGALKAEVVPCEFLAILTWGRVDHLINF